MFPQSGLRPSNLVAEMHRYGQMLRQTERLPPERLRAYQGRLLAQLLRHARTTTKFYRDRLDFDVDSPASLQSSWAKIPILTRAEAVKNRLKLMSSKTPPDAGPKVTGLTSGSTGMPFAFESSAITSIATKALHERLRRWWCMDGAKSLAAIAPDRRKEAPPPEGLTVRGWHWDHPEGIGHTIGLETDVDTHLDWLIARCPDYLFSYSTILKALAQAARKRGIELKLELLLSYATVLDEETRDLCRAVFGAEIADSYSAQETGHLAAQCPQCGEYHIGAEAVVVEVLDAQGKEVDPGEIGRVVVTPLYNYAMPLIRYALGDMAEAGSAPARCGRGLPSLRRILGRYRNMFRYRDGSTSWPNAHQIMADFVALKQYQVVQTDLDQIEIRYVPDGEGTDQPIDLAALTHRVRTVLRQPVDVTVRRVDRIERSPGGKFEDCISLVAANGMNAAPTSRQPALQS